MAILNFGQLSPPAELRDLHETFPDTRLLVLANRPTESESRQLLAFGATACLGKSTEARDILHAIHLASRGVQVLPPIAGVGFGAGGDRRRGGAGGAGGVMAPAHDMPELLTWRETQVLELISSGRSNAEIAAALQRQRRDRAHPRAARVPQARRQQAR